MGSPRSAPGFVTALVVSWLAVVTAVPISSADVDEYAAKGLFVHNLLKFVSWVGDAPAPGTALKVAVVSTTPAASFTAVLQGKTVKGRLVTVETVDNVDKAVEPNVVFIAADMAGQFRRILKELDGRPLLTIADEGSDGAQAVVALTTADARLAFEVNLDTATRAGVRIDANVLALARHVRGARKQGAR